MIDLNLYHWVWYLLGFISCPKLTVMIFITLHFKNDLPLALFVIGWVFAMLGLFGTKTVRKTE